MKHLVSSLNRGWVFSSGFEPAYAAELQTGFEPVCLPHNVRELPVHYFDETSYQGIYTYQKELVLTDDQCAGRLFADFGAVMAAAEVYCNGTLVCTHLGGYTDFSAELTHACHPGKNLLCVRVDTRERDDIPPFGYMIDYLTFGGIYREVSLRQEPETFLSHVFAKPDAEQKTLTMELTFASGAPAEGVVSYTLSKDGALAASGEAAVAVCDGTKVTLTSGKIENLLLWDVDDPQLYDLAVTFTCGDDTCVRTCRVGFRTVAMTKDGFFLNGKPLKLRGLDRHQQYPYVGYAMPARVQRQDADILRRQLHLNVVRTSHYPQSVSFLDRCDEIGLLVFEEIPGWQHIGGEGWKQVACQNVREMILRDCNHPSIFLWGVRINESRDDHDFYVETNRIAHELDDTRPTGGVRCIEHSELLEDVYTMNDFIHAGKEAVLRDPKEITGTADYVPYLVTEFNGHMYPTKRYDQEERLKEHALRHARVQNAAALEPHSCGAIGWCAFDYNTHRFFGSGDKVCYHGVSDMFRLLKPAAAVYASQCSPEEELVMVPDTIWSTGEKNEGGLGVIHVYTNCDAVRLYLDGKLLGQWEPDRESFPGLPHPPVTVDVSQVMMLGQPLADGCFVGLLHGQEAIRKQFDLSPVPTALRLIPDEQTLSCGDWDAVRVTVRLEDQAGNLLPFAFDPVQLTVTGVGDIIGPKLTSLSGGITAFWVKTLGDMGEIRLSADCLGLHAEAALQVQENS